MARHGVASLVSRRRACATRVTRRGGDVVRATALRCARALHEVVCTCGAARGRRARLGGASYASAQPIASLGDAKAAYAPRSSDFAADFAALLQGLYIGAVHARAAREDCETRRSHFNYVRAEVLSAACQTGESNSLVLWLHSSGKESCYGSRRRHTSNRTRGTRLSSQRHRQSTAEQTRCAATR